MVITVGDVVQVLDTSYIKHGRSWLTTCPNIVERVENTRGVFVTNFTFSIETKPNEITVMVMTSSD